MLHQPLPVLITGPWAHVAELEDHLRLKRRPVFLDQFGRKGDIRFKEQVKDVPVASEGQQVTDRPDPKPDLLKPRILSPPPQHLSYHLAFVAMGLCCRISDRLRHDSSSY